MNTAYPLFTSETMDFRADLSRFLLPGETVANASGSISPDTISAQSVTSDATGATMRVSGGAGGRTLYRASFHITTSTGRVKTVMFQILSLSDPSSPDTLPRIYSLGSIVYAR